MKIEKLRETRAQQEKRRKELVITLEAAKTVQSINPQYFILRLSDQANCPASEVKAIEMLHAMKRYLDEDDPECYPCLEALRRTFDAVRREPNYRLNTAEITKLIDTLKGRLQWFIDNKSPELSISA